ncbi:hypothetical protein P3TCK_16539 [Photobacterium profundum 3TCK]|uniref:Uncharacterized protein n=1 Tax=Photobacterium profundum 3TCK TaxID=314280 RepID=Q1Z154_9GAMM|nr:hypothetical protein P3TCK_16539 [Photobacterium profundum 3TCK]
MFKLLIIELSADYSAKRIMLDKKSLKDGCFLSLIPGGREQCLLVFFDLFLCRN